MPLFDLFGKPDLSAYGGLMDPESLQKLQAEMAKQQQWATTAALLDAGGASLTPINLGQAIARGINARQQAGGQFLQGSLPPMIQAQQFKVKQQQEAAQKAEAAQRQQALQTALGAGDWAQAATIDPQATNAFRQATEPKQTGPVNVGPGGALVDPRTGKIIFQAPFRPEAPQQPPTGFRWNAQGGLEPIPGGPSDPNAPKAPGAISPDAALKVSQLQNAVTAGEQYKKLVLNPDGSFNDIKARMPEARRLLVNAIRAKLRAESGATITDDEVQAELERYGAQWTSSDSVNADAVERLLSDLQNQIQSVSPQGRATIGMASPLVAPQGVAKRGASVKLQSGATLTYE